MIKVYTQKNCPDCNRLKSLLTKAGIAFEEVTDPEEFEKDLEPTGLMFRDLRSSPVMVNGEEIWEGADCLVAVEKGEVES